MFTEWLNSHRYCCSSLAFLLACVLATVSFCAEYHVAPAPAGSDANGGTGWDDAFLTISNALAQSDVTVVTVSNGTYAITNTISVTNAVTIQSFGGGNYGGLENASNTVVNHIASSGRAVTLDNPGIVLDGLTISGGSGKFIHGKGIYMTGGSVLNCILFENGNGADSDGNSVGGGVYMTSGLVSNCTIQANVITEGKGVGGAGIYAQGASRIIRCRVLDNKQLRTYPCLAGGIYAASASVKIQNCLVARNVVRDSAGGIYGGTIVNCTVVSNKVRLTTGGEAGGVYLPAGSSISNSIIYFNEVNGVHTNLNTTVGAGYSCFTIPDDLSNGNISDDPLFEDLSGDAFRTTELSPCIDRGNSSVVTWGTDLDGNRRVAGIVDMGIYEFQPPAGTVLIVR